MIEIISKIFNRLGITVILILIQLVIAVASALLLSEYLKYFFPLIELISFILVIWIVNIEDNPSYKLAWCLLILLFPIFGGLLYLIFGAKKVSKKFAKKFNREFKYSIPHLKQDDKIIKSLKQDDTAVAGQSQYIRTSSQFPVYNNTDTKYYPLGEYMFEDLLVDLKKAKKFIFLEFFIIQEGKMWNTILDILTEKVAEGVEVRVMYDDAGCISTLPYKYNKHLESLGIKCRVAQQFKPFLSFKANNRDHRKIIVIDGVISYTGGINLADEYINEVERFGHWKDCAVRMIGDATWGFTVMFLQMWNFDRQRDKDYSVFKPNANEMIIAAESGYVQPFGDIPLDDEVVGELAYINMLNRAKDYVYINTPYLVIDNELLTSLYLASKNGVDVRVVTPGIPDKWYVHLLTRSYYAQLIKAGIRVYEYSPGFIHSKTFVADDELAIIGTINLDYRSLYLHFECAAWMYKSNAVMKLKEDYLKTLNYCKEYTLEECENIPLPNKIIKSLLRLFAPLM